MAKNKKGKQKAQSPGGEEEDGRLGTIPENGHAENNWGGAEGDWNQEETPWSDPQGGGDNDWGQPASTAYDQRGQGHAGWGQTPDPGDWGQPTNSAGDWDQQWHAVSSNQPASVPPTSHQSPRANTKTSWQTWGDEAQKYRRIPLAPPATGNPFPRGVAFANDTTYIPDHDPYAQQAIYDSIQGANLSQKQRRSKKSKQTQEQPWSGMTTHWQADDSWGQQGYWGDHGGGGDDPVWHEEHAARQYTVTPAKMYSPGPNPPYKISRTMAYATGYAPDAENVIRPGSMTHEPNEIETYTDGPFILSDDALRSAERALFGRERMAKDRIHWRFPHEKDARVREVMDWIKRVSDGLGALGLRHFLEDGERGALFVNADFHLPGQNEPVIQWLLYEDVVSTQEKKIQESVGFYNPSTEAVVFVILPSKTGNSAAIWRRKVSIPDHVRLSHLREISNVMSRLRTDYPVYVDELSSTIDARASKEKKKKGFFSRLFRAFKIFKIEW